MYLNGLCKPLQQVLQLQEIKLEPIVESLTKQAPQKQIDYAD
jgi:hypothetical protein